MIQIKSKNGKILKKVNVETLQGANLEGADLRRANLEGADLQKTDLRWANLREANLYGADLEGANLYRANLQGANLEGADLRRANLEGANLQRANLYRANLYGADLEGANLYRANVDFSCWPLSCGSFNITVDEKILYQLLFHIYNLKCDSPIFKLIKIAIKPFVEKSHLITKHNCKIID